MFLVVIDAGSKWIEVFPMQTLTSASTNEHLRICFPSLDCQILWLQIMDLPLSVLNMSNFYPVMESVTGTVPRIIHLAMDWQRRQSKL